MNNRLIATLLSFCMIVSFLAFPALAEENSNWIDLMDFGGVNGTSTNSLIVLDNASFYYMLPERMTVGYIDIVFYSNRGINAITDSYGNELTLVQLDSFYYRAYGNIPRETNTRVSLIVDATSNSVNTSITFLSVRAGSFYTSNVYPLGFDYRITDSATPQTGSVLPGSGTNITFYQNSDLYEPQEYTCKFSFEQWKTYDSIDVVLSGRVYSIDSIRVSIDGVAVPISLDPLVVSNTQVNFSVCFSADISNIDKNLTGSMEILVEGHFRANGDVEYVDLVSAVGLVYGNSVEPEIFWFTKLVNTIATWGQNIVNALGGDADSNQFEQGVSDANDKLSDASDAMNDFTRPAADTVVPDLGEFDNSSVEILSQFFNNQLVSPLVTAGLAVWLIGIIFGV